MIRKMVKRLLHISDNRMTDIDALRRSGMSIGNDCEIYDQISLGSEPYLISIGDMSV